MTSVGELISVAVQNTGSKAQLARILDVPPQHVNNWITGERSCSPEDRARIAAIANQDAVQELVRATLEKHAGTKKGDQLWHILGKSLQATGGATVSVLLGLTSGACLTLPMMQRLLDTMYRSVKLRAAS